MNYSIIQKISIILVMIVSITYLVIKLFINRIKVDSIRQEMMSLMVENNKLSNEYNYNPEGDDDFEIYSYVKQEGFSNVIEGLDVGKEMKKVFERPFNKMKDALGGPINKIVNFVKDVDEAFKSIPKRTKAFAQAFDDVGEGIKLEFVNLGKSINLGFTDIFDLVETVGKCGIKTIQNLRICIIWYILDLLGSTLYNIIVVLPVFMIRMITGFDIQPFVNIVHGFIECLDLLFFNFTCYHLIHFPDWVIRDCYTCKFSDKVDKLNLDWGKTIPDLMNQPTKKFKDAEKNFRTVFG